MDTFVGIRAIWCVEIDPHLIHFDMGIHQPNLSFPHTFFSPNPIHYFFNISFSIVKWLCGHTALFSFGVLNKWTKSRKYTPLLLVNVIWIDFLLTHVAMEITLADNKNTFITTQNLHLHFHEQRSSHRDGAPTLADPSLSFVRCTTASRGAQGLLDSLYACVCLDEYFLLNRWVLADLAFVRLVPMPPMLNYSKILTRYVLANNILLRQQRSSDCQNLTFRSHVCCIEYTL